MACSASDDVAPTADAGSSESNDAGSDAADGGSSELDAGRRPDSGPPVPASPREVSCEGTPCYVAVSGNSGHHVCGLLSDGTVRCWGSDSADESVPTTPDAPYDGALGRGKAVRGDEAATPSPVVDLTNVTQISVGPNYGTCARTTDGAVFCWGRNDFGQLGRAPSDSALPTPTRIEGLPPIEHVELGQRIGCGIGTDKGLYCWGEVTSGLGLDPNEGPTFSPRRITTFEGALQSLVVGTWTNRDTIVARLENGVLVNAGEFPVGETSLHEPPSVPLEIDGVLHAGAFAYVTNDGLLTRWQSNYGTIEVDHLYIPASEKTVSLRISGANLANRRQQGGALLSNGRFFRWGPNEGGTLGIAPEKLTESAYPIEVLAVRDQVVSFATTSRSTCVSLVGGQIQCWGGNVHGELGLGSVDLDAHPEGEVIR
jgi:hypothetical protein